MRSHIVIRFQTLYLTIVATFSKYLCNKRQIADNTELFLFSDTKGAHRFNQSASREATCTYSNQFGVWARPNLRNRAKKRNDAVFRSGAINREENSTEVNTR